MLPAAALAQTPAPADPSEEQVEAWFNEFQQVHQQLEGIQAEALQDPALNAAQEELGEEIQLAMATADPNLDQRVARVQAIEAEAAAAQQEGDVERLQELMGEAQDIQNHFMQVQAATLEQPAIATKLAAFQEQLEARMIDINPEAQALMTRFRELEQRIEAALMPGG